MINDALRRAGAALSVAQAASAGSAAFGGVNEKLLGHVRKRAGVEQRAVVPAQQASDLGSNLGIDAFLGSIRNRNLLDLLLQHALSLPDGIRAPILGSGTVAEPVAEGAAIPVSKSTLQDTSLSPYRLAALTVISKRLLQAPGDNAPKLVQHQLESAVINASNTAVLGALNTSSVAGVGDVVDDLMIGLEAADDSASYVVAAAPSAVRALAVKSDGRMGVRGGEFVPDVHVIPVADVDYLAVIPAARVVVNAGEFELKTSESATVEMLDNPSGNAVTPGPVEAVSMFQTNSVAVLAQREFGLYAAVDAVEVTSNDS